MISERERQRIVRALGCLVKGCHAPADLHHVRTAANSGTAMKPSSKWEVPLCHDHHMECHRGQRTFERRYGIDLAAEARTLAQVDGEMP